MNDGAIRHASPHPPEPENKHKCGGCRLQAELDGLRQGLDAAWEQAEAALPEGWSNGPTLFGYDVLGGGRAYTANVIAPKPYRRARQRTLIGDGPTPAAALQALATRLRATTDETGGGT